LEPQLAGVAILAFFTVLAVVMVGLFPAAEADRRLPPEDG
jgi:hypothetical protein